jgi:hypothetical protein
MTSHDLSTKMVALYMQLHDLQTQVEEAGDAAHLAHDGKYQDVLEQACYALGKAADNTITAANYLVRHRIIKGESK